MGHWPVNVKTLASGTWPVLRRLARDVPKPDSTASTSTWLISNLGYEKIWAMTLVVYVSVNCYMDHILFLITF